MAVHQHGFLLYGRPEIDVQIKRFGCNRIYEK